MDKRQAELLRLCGRMDEWDAGMLRSLVLSILESIVSRMDDDGSIADADGCLNDILADLNNDGLEPRLDVKG